MIVQFLRNRYVYYAFLFLAGLVVLACIFTPQIVALKKLSNYTVHIMLMFLGGGLFFLLTDSKKIMFASFAYCGILCLFLKTTSNQNLRLSTDSGTPSISISHVNLGSGSMDYESTLELVMNKDVDLINFSEVTPDWTYYLETILSKKYRYSAKNIRIDPFGSALYSKIPIHSIDTLNYSGSPHLSVKVFLGLNRFAKIVNAYFLPSLTRQAYGDCRVELLRMSQEIERFEEPTLCIGDFNLPDWSNEMREFKSMGKLSSSRRDISPGSSTGLKSLFNFPTDHIFFTGQLECNNFSTLQDIFGNHIGMTGKYQIKSKSL